MTTPPPELLEAMAQQDPEPPLHAEAAERVRARLRVRVAAIPFERRRRRQRRLFVAAGTLACAAAAVAIAVQVQPTQAPEATPAQTLARWHVQLAEGATLTWSDAAGGEHALQQAGSLRAPDHLETDSLASAQVTTPDGVELRLAPRTRLRTPRSGDTSRAEVQLAEGAVDVQVPPLGQRRSFRVRTRDTEVIVHGTRFRVELVDDAGDARTCVRVQEGKVEVRNPRGVRFLEAGEAEGCEGHGPTALPSSGPAPRAAIKEPDTAAQPRQRTNAPVAGKKPRSHGREATPVQGQGALVEQNELLMRALAAERQGDLEGAGRAFEQLLRQHPDSPLSPEARRGLARVQQ